jgi:hypothetical protein
MPALVIGEICVYLVEYIAYLLMFKAKSRLRLAAYTLTANSVTLACGLAANRLLLLGAR